MGGGVTGSTTDFGSVSTGSSPVPPAMSVMTPPIAILLAAGKGTRMESELAKVLHPVAGRPMVRWVLDAVEGLSPCRTMVVLGHRSEEVAAVLPPDIEWCLQAEQLGTGHAVQVALSAIGPRPPGSPVLVVSGDMPLITTSLLDRLISSHHEARAALSLVTSIVEDTRGFGRVVRARDGSVAAVVEERDADEATRAIREVNAGIYVFDGDLLEADLAHVNTENSQNEYYLPDVIAMATGRGEKIVAVLAEEAEVVGINTLDQLAEADRLLRRRLPPV